MPKVNRNIKEGGILKPTVLRSVIIKTQIRPNSTMCNLQHILKYFVQDFLRKKLFANGERGRSSQQIKIRHGMEK
jgi:hypothetical protein